MTITDPVLLLAGVNFAAVVLFIVRFDKERAHWWVLQLFLYLAGSVLSTAEPTLAWGIGVLGVSAIAGLTITMRLYVSPHLPKRVNSIFGDTTWELP